MSPDKLQLLKTGLAFARTVRDGAMRLLGLRPADTAGDPVRRDMVQPAVELEQANTCFRLGDYAQAQTLGLAALEKARASGATRQEGATHWILGETALRLGELETAVDHFQKGADRFTQVGDDKATRRTIDRLVQILGDHPDAESAQFYRSLAAEHRPGHEADGSAITRH